MASQVQRILAGIRAAEAAGATPQNVLDAALSAAARFPAAESATPPTPTTAYRAKDGDTLDAVAAQVYGDEYTVLDVLAANPALASRVHLMAGALVGLPPVTPPVREIPTTQIWE